MTSKSVIKRVAVQTRSLQEKIFKFLWPDKCWYNFEVTGKPYKTMDRQRGAWVCQHFHCDNLFENTNPDLSDPSNTFMILDRLRVMGYEVDLCNHVIDGLNAHSCQVKREGGVLYSYNATGYGNSFPEATVNALNSLMEKEEER